MYLVLDQFFIVRTILCATVQTCATFATIITTIITHLLFLSHNYSLFCSQHNFVNTKTCSLFFSLNYSLFCSRPLRRHSCSLDVYSSDFQTTIFLFTRNAFSHKTYRITTDCSLLCFALSYSNIISIMNVLEVENLCSRLLENSIASSFLFVYYIHSSCVRLRYAFVIYIFHTHTDIVVGILKTSSLYIYVSVGFVLSFLILNNIR